MPHQTTDRDFPQEDDSAHARIVDDPLNDPEKKRVEKVMEIARMVQGLYRPEIPLSYDFYEIALKAALIHALPDRTFHWS